MKTATLVVALTSAVVIAACAKEQTQDTQTPAYGQQPQGSGQYPGTGQGTSTQQPTYTQPTTTSTAPAANPLALACQADATCLTAKCNLQTGHCMFPCASSADCQTGNGCVAGACVPGVQ